MNVAVIVLGVGLMCASAGMMDTNTRRSGMVIAMGVLTLIAGFVATLIGAGIIH